MTTKTNELFEAITAKLIKLIEEGEAEGSKWNKPWTSLLAGSGFSFNPVTKKGYSGMNELILMATTAYEGHTANVWATYKQWASIEAQVQKGEKGTKLIKWGVSEKCKTCNIKKARPGCKSGKHIIDRHMWASPFTVFNADQVDGYEVIPPKKIEDLGNAPEKVKEIEDFITATKAVIKHKAGDSAHYVPATDIITLPLAEQFSTTEGYYSTKLHELTHWTGNESRLDRDIKNTFGSDKYAAEELVAELGSTFLNAHFGTEAVPNEEHAHYLASWLRSFKDNPMALYRAAKQAQAAVDFLQGLQPKEEGA